MEPSNWNDETRDYIRNFYIDLFEIFPELESKKELFDGRLQRNIPNGITFGKEFKAKRSPSSKDKRASYQVGEFQAYDQIIVDPDCNKKEDVLFHELCHAINYPPKGKTYSCPDSFVEILTTLIESYRIHHKTGVWPKKRVNGYLDDFGRELLLVIGKPLLTQFLIDEKYLYQVIPVSEEWKDTLGEDLYQKECLADISQLMGKITSLVRRGKPDEVLILYVRKVEEQILKLLLHKLDSTKGQAFIQPLSDLIKMQDYPSYHTYYTVLNNAVRDGKITLNDYDSFPLAMVWNLIDYIKLPEEETNTNDQDIKKLLSFWGQKYINDDNHRAATEHLFELGNYLSDVNLDTFVSANPYMGIRTLLEEYNHRQETILQYLAQYGWVLDAVLEGEVAYHEAKTMAMLPEESTTTSSSYQEQLQWGKSGKNSSEISNFLQNLRYRQEVSVVGLTRGQQIVSFVNADGVYTPVSWGDFCELILRTSPLAQEIILPFLGDQYGEETQSLLFYVEKTQFQEDLPIDYYVLRKNGQAVRQELDMEALFLDEDYLSLVEKSFPLFPPPLAGIEEKQERRH